MIFKMPEHTMFYYDESFEDVNFLDLNVIRC